MKRISFAASIAAAIMGNLFNVQPVEPLSGPLPGEGKRAKEGKRRYSAALPMTVPPQREEYPSRQAWRAAMRAYLTQAGVSK